MGDRRHEDFAKKNTEEIGRLQAQLRTQEETLRSHNYELLQQRDAEYNAKVSLEKQKEKDRSIMILRRKEQELVVKDQQLRAARRRIEELELDGCRKMGAPPSATVSTASSERSTSCGPSGSASGRSSPLVSARNHRRT